MDEITEVTTMTTVQIKLHDTGKDRYTLEYVCGNTLGRRYDNNAFQLEIIRPKNEKDRTLTASITTAYQREPIGGMAVVDNKITITSAMSQFPDINIGFSFTDDTGYCKNSDIAEFVFLRAQRPPDFAPEPIPTMFEQRIDAINGEVIYGGLESAVSYLEGTKDAILTAVESKTGVPSSEVFRDVVGQIEGLNAISDETIERIDAINGEVVEGSPNDKIEFLGESVDRFNTALADKIGAVAPEFRQNVETFEGLDIALPPLDNFEEIQVDSSLFANSSNFLAIFNAEVGLLASENVSVDAGIVFIDYAAKTMTKVWNTGINWNTYFAVPNGVMIFSSTIASGLFFDFTTKQCYETGILSVLNSYLGVCAVSDGVLLSLPTTRQLWFYNTKTRTATLLITASGTQTANTSWIMNPVENGCYASFSANTQSGLFFFDYATNELRTLWSFGSVWDRFVRVKSGMLYATGQITGSAVLFIDDNQTVYQKTTGQHMLISLENGFVLAYGSAGIHSFNENTESLLPLTVSSFTVSPVEVKGGYLFHGASGMVFVDETSATLEWVYAGMAAVSAGSVKTNNGVVLSVSGSSLSQGTLFYNENTRVGSLILNVGYGTPHVALGEKGFFFRYNNTGVIGSWYFDYETEEVTTTEITYGSITQIPTDSDILFYSGNSGLVDERGIFHVNEQTKTVTLLYGSTLTFNISTKTNTGVVIASPSTAPLLFFDYSTKQLTEIAPSMSTNTYQHQKRVKNGALIGVTSNYKVLFFNENTKTTETLEVLFQNANSFAAVAGGTFVYASSGVRAVYFFDDETNTLSLYTVTNSLAQFSAWGTDGTIAITGSRSLVLYPQGGHIPLTGGEITEDYSSHFGTVIKYSEMRSASTRFYYNSLAFNSDNRIVYYTKSPTAPSGFLVINK